MGRLFRVLSINNSLFSQIGDYFGEPLPWQLDRQLEWSDKHLSSFQPISNHQIGSIKLSSINNVDYKAISSEQVLLNSMECSGESTEIFPVRGRQSRLHNSNEVKFYRLENVSILELGELGNIVFDSQDNIIEELSSPFWRVIYILNFEVKNLKATNAVEVEAGIALCDRFVSPNYAHWLLDLVPRIQSQSLFNETKPTWITKPISNQWQSDMLSRFKVDLKAVKQLHCGDLIRLKSCIFCHDFSGRVNHPANKANRTSLNQIRSILTQFSNKIVPNLALLIQRKGSRSLIGTGAIVELLEKAGFNVMLVDTATVSVDQQIQLFSSAKLVVAVHGAGLANCAFMEEDSCLIEILPNYCNPAFSLIARSLGVNYFGISGVTESGADLRPMLKNVMVDHYLLSGIDNALSSLDS